MKRHNALREEKQGLLEQITELKKQVAGLESENEELVKKYEDLKIAKLLAATDDDKKQVKVRINKIMREIDRCIAQLNV